MSGKGGLEVCPPLVVGGVDSGVRGNVFSAAGAITNAELVEETPIAEAEDPGMAIKASLNVDGATSWSIEGRSVFPFSTVVRFSTIVAVIFGSFDWSLTTAVGRGVFEAAATFDLDWPRMCGLSSASSDISPSLWRRSEEAEEVKDVDDGCNIHADVNADSVSSAEAAKEKTVSCGTKVSRTDWNCTVSRTCNSLDVPSGTYLRMIFFLRNCTRP